MMREVWTIADVLALPAGEHDYFERKSGRVFVSSEFRNTLSKAVSAFANSGGGHIILGVADNGHVDGVSRKAKGRAELRQWLEQIIPELVEPELDRFRVHEVSIEGIGLSAEDVVIVIDVGDSNFAPFQSRALRQYFYRVGGHSKPAPHFYLEVLRNRLTKPELRAEICDVKLIGAWIRDKKLMAQALVTFQVENVGGFTPDRWYLDLFINGRRISASGVVTRNSFPRPCFSIESRDQVMRTPILPGQKRTFKDLLLLQLPYEFSDGGESIEPLDRMITELGNWTSTVVTESSRGVENLLDISKFSSAMTPESIRCWIQNFDSASRSGHIGGGLNVSILSIEEIKNFDDHVHFYGVIENTSDTKYRQVNLFVNFLDARLQQIAQERVEIGVLHPKQRKPWKSWILAAEIWSYERIEIAFLDQSWFVTE